MKCAECGSGGNVWGNEVRGVYDGVLYWSCGDCGFAWSRDWTGFGRRQEEADRIVAAINAARARVTTDVPTPPVSAAAPG